MKGNRINDVNFIVSYRVERGNLGHGVNWDTSGVNWDTNFCINLLYFRQVDR